MTQYLWILLITGQILSAGNMNYQQEQGLYEINPIYLEYPSNERVWFTKGLELGVIYGATKVWPRYEKKILTTANLYCWGFIMTDKFKGIKLGFRF